MHNGHSERLQFCEGILKQNTLFGKLTWSKVSTVKDLFVLKATILFPGKVLKKKLPLEHRVRKKFPIDLTLQNNTDSYEKGERPKWMNENIVFNSFYHIWDDSWMGRKKFVLFGMK